MGTGDTPVAAARIDSSRAVDLYLDLLQRSLIGLIEEDDSCLVEEFVDDNGNLSFRDVSKGGFDREARVRGEDIPTRALTLCGLTRLDNVRKCFEHAIHDDVPGDLIETGVFRGGATIFMKGLVEAYGESLRKVWVADSFVGCPYNPAKYPADRGYDFSGPEMNADAPSADEVKDSFARYGLLDERVVFLEGWFKDTLPRAPIDRLCLLRLDGDIYESTWDGLIHLYPKLSPGGHVIIDDYGAFEPCRKAVDDYRQQQGIRDQIEMVDDYAVYWRKT